MNAREETPSTLTEQEIINFIAWLEGEMARIEARSRYIDLYLSEEQLAEVERAAK